MWRYLFRRDDPNPAPWTEKGKKIIENRGFECIYPEGYKEKLKAEAELKKNKPKTTPKGKGKGKGRGRKRKAEDEEDNEANEEKKEEEEEKEKEEEEIKEPEKKKKRRYEIEEHFLDMIKKDEKNKKIWDKVLDGEHSTLLDFTEKVESTFECPICVCIVTAPITPK